MVNDGTFLSLQVVYHDNMENFAEISKLNVGAAVIVTGTLVATPQAKQPFEIQAQNCRSRRASAPDYPLQKKRHSFEYLRTIAHLRPRTNTFQAVFRVRSLCAYAIHKFFQERGFVYVHTPLITGSDCEGAGEMFQVTTLDLNNVPKMMRERRLLPGFLRKRDKPYCKRTVKCETYAQAFRNVYTFGPTFRAENSNTTRHAAEFWMIEPEMAFADLDDDMDRCRSYVEICHQLCAGECTGRDELLQFIRRQGTSGQTAQRSNSDFASDIHRGCRDFLRNTMINLITKYPGDATFRQSTNDI